MNLKYSKVYIEQILPPRICLKVRKTKQTKDGCLDIELILLFTFFIGAVDAEIRGDIALSCNLFQEAMETHYSETAPEEVS